MRTTLGMAIRRWKTQTGSSADDLAKLVGCGRRVVFDWQADRAVPSAEYRPALCRVLGLEADELLGLVGEGVETPPYPDIAISIPGEVAQTIEHWRARVCDDRLSIGVTAVLLVLPCYMRITGEIRTSALQIATDKGWKVGDVTKYFADALESGHVVEVRPGVYRLTSR